MRTGTIYIVSTPIGNMDDITLRALKILAEVQVVAAEDTREAGKLLARHGIKTRLTSFHEHNERERTPRIIDKVLAGESVALVSDAGTPAISDPGYRLVLAAVESGIRVVPIPGPSAAIAGLSVSGLPTDTFVFVGFPSKKKEKRLKQLRALAEERRTLIFYESPNRVIRLLGEILQTMDDRRGVLCREMTKLHEEFVRGPLSEIINTINNRPSVKGECTLVIEGAAESEDIPIELLRQEIENALAEPNARISDLSRKLAEQFGIPKKKVYNEALKISGRKNRGNGKR